MTHNVCPDTSTLWDTHHRKMVTGATKSNHRRLGVITGLERGLRPQKDRKHCDARLDTLASPVFKVCLTSHHEIFGQLWEIMLQYNSLYIAERTKSIYFRSRPPRPIHLARYVVFSHWPLPSVQRAGALSCCNHNLTIPLISPSNSNRKDSIKLGFLWAASLSVSRWRPLR
jgi:hypothetical protein